MKRKSVIGIIALSAIVVGGIPTIVLTNNNIGLSHTNAGSGYNLDAFAFYRANPGSQVTLTTVNGNGIVLNANGVTVDGNKLVIAPDGYLEVARDDLKANLNALDGLTKITTDFVGRIEYSHRDKAVIFDDAISGNYTFNADHKPSFFKLHNDSDANVEMTSFNIEYSCETFADSVLPGAKSFTVTDGVIEPSANKTSVNIPLQARKGVVSYTLRNNRTTGATRVGFVVGLEPSSDAWYEEANDKYVWATLGGASKGISRLLHFNGTDVVEDAGVWGFAGYTKNDWVDYTLKFDVDNHYYALYRGDQLLGVDRTTAVNGSNLGIRFNYTDTAIKNIKIAKDVDFVKEDTRPGFLNDGKYDIHYDSTLGCNVYTTTTESSVLVFNEELPSTGTVSFAYYANSAPKYWSEGVGFVDRTDFDKYASGHGAIFGSSGTKFNATSCFHKNSEDKDTQNWMTGRNNGNFSYTLGTWVYVKIDYDLPNQAWTLSKKDNPGDEWTITGTCTETEADRDITGMKYLVLKTSSARSNATEEDTFRMSIHSLVVNGVAW